MDKRSLGILLAFALLIAGIIAYFNSLGPNHNWQESYARDGKLSEEPYGTGIFQQILSNEYGSNFIEIEDSLSLLNNYANQASYIYVGSRAFYDSTSAAQLTQFASKGNHVFIAAKNISYNLLEHYLYKFPDTTYYDGYNEFRVDSLFLGDFRDQSSTLYLPDYQDSVTLDFRYVNDSITYTFAYIIAKEVKNNYTLQEIAFSSSTVTGIRIQVENEGTVTFFTAPLLFTNYHLLREESFEFINQLISPSLSETVIWDQKNRISSYTPNRKRKPSNSYNPLGYLLSFPAFKWAWYILLFMGVALISFNFKRKQRIMPIHVENKNTSLSFVETLGLLFYQSNANDQIAKKELELFQYQVRKRYGLAAQEFSEDFAHQLSKRSNVDYAIVKKLTDKARAVQYLKNISDEMLIAFHQSIEEFFKSAQ